MRPMLCTSFRSIAVTADEAVEVLMAKGGWEFGIKIDGTRGLARIQGGSPRLFGRSGREVTALYPDVVAQLAGAPDCTLDGEIVCLGTDGLPDVHRVAARENTAPERALLMSQRYPAFLSPFDLLSLAGVDRRLEAYETRQQYLAEVAAGIGAQVYPRSMDGRTLLEFVLQMRLEGLVAKRLRSAYIGGRSPDWVKIPIKASLFCDVIAWTPGQGSREHTFGALQLAVHTDDGTMVHLGKVGTGFSETELVEIRSILDAGTQLVVLVEHLGFMADGSLRNPVFTGPISDDITLATARQLDAD